jgi:hypothetical protein
MIASQRHIASTTLSDSWFKRNFVNPVVDVKKEVVRFLPDTFNSAGKAGTQAVNFALPVIEKGLDKGLGGLGEIITGTVGLALGITSTALGGQQMLPGQMSQTTQQQQPPQNFLSNPLVLLGIAGGLILLLKNGKR